MLYALLIYGDPAAAPADLDIEEQHRTWMTYTEEMIASGGHRGGAALQPADTATTVRSGSSNGDIVNTDGPFAETKEILGGFYLIDVENLDEALAWASRMPNIAYASVEVRPVLPMS
jgi:hypothetical protein